MSRGNGDSVSLETWGLAELVDFEALLFADRELSEQALTDRDSKIGAPLTDAGPSRRRLLSAWLASMRNRAGQRLPGSGVEEAYRHATWMICVALFIVGMGSAAAVLRFTGEHPINVLVVLGLFVFAQIVAVVLTVVLFAVAARAPALFEGLPLAVFIRGSVSWLGRRSAKRLVSGTERGAVVGWMRGRRSLYAGAERRLVFAVLQRGAIAFNLGVLASFIVTVIFSDLAFGWGTTLNLGAERLHRICSLLAAPWAAWLDRATVSLSLVEATQYSRYTGAYIDAAGARGAAAFGGRWWPFLAMSITVYGLVPRLLLWITGEVLVRRALDELPSNTPEVQRLIARLSHPGVRRPHPLDPGVTVPLGEGYDAVREPTAPYDGDDALCTRWRDADVDALELDTALLERYGLHVEGELGSSGGHDYDADLEFLGRAAGSSLPVFVVVEPWSHPDRAFQRLVEGLRERVGPQRAINVVFMGDANPADLAIWTGYLSEMADPYLGLDRVALLHSEAVS